MFKKLLYKIVISKCFDIAKLLKKVLHKIKIKLVKLNYRNKKLVNFTDYHDSNRSF